MKRIGIKSCEDMYEQVGILQKTAVADGKTSIPGKITNNVDSIKFNTDYVVIKLHKRIRDLDGLALKIAGTDGEYCDNPGSEYRILFDIYDDENKTIVAYPSEKLMEVMLDHTDPKDYSIVVDMKWLIEITRQFFEDHCDDFGIPRFEPHFEEDEYDFNMTPPSTEEQKEAVRTVLNNKVSYIWGAPGTGKTQYVLATSIIAYLKHGKRNKRVAIVAPTNNSVEQVLRGVMKVIDNDPNHSDYIDPKKDILRLGTATKEFAQEFSYLCENKAIENMMEKLRNSIELREELLFEREIDHLDANFDYIEQMCDQYGTATFERRKEMEEEVAMLIKRIKKVLSQSPALSTLMNGVDEFNVKEKGPVIRKMLKSRSRPLLDFTELKELSDDDIRAEITDYRNEYMKYSNMQCSCKATQVKIMAMTPQVMMSRPSLFEAGGIKDVDHIFVDEAGYANLIQTMSVFMCGPPVALLGDHMQLPPVCEAEREKLEVWAQRDDYDSYMKYGFMWDQSIRFIESYLLGSIDEARDEYLDENSDPRYELMRTSSLTDSKRFDDSLARILDECVYHNGMTGIKKDGDDDGEWQVICYNVKGASYERRNQNEIDAITKYLEKNGPKLGEFAILTPYRTQREGIAKNNPKYDESVMTIHKSQGREWDTVIISVSDNSTSNKKIPLHLTGSLSPNTGLKVMNTAVSRAKKRLIIFCEYDFWVGQTEFGKDLLGTILRNDCTEVRYDV